MIIDVVSFVKNRCIFITIQEQFILPKSTSAIYFKDSLLKDESIGAVIFTQNWSELGYLETCNLEKSKSKI